MPNLLQEPFTKVWLQSPLRSIIDLKKSAVLAYNRECVTCAEFKHCGGGCRALALIATGKLLSISQEVCAMYKNKHCRA